MGKKLLMVMPFSSALPISFNSPWLTVSKTSFFYGFDMVNSAGRTGRQITCSLLFTLK